MTNRALIYVLIEGQATQIYYQRYLKGILTITLGWNMLLIYI